MATILCVDDEPNIGLVVEDTLAKAGHRTLVATSVPDAIKALEQDTVDLIISDYRMPGLTGMEFLNLLAREGHAVHLIMITGYGSIEHAVAAIRAGALDYITKPIRPEQLTIAVDQALDYARLERENERLRREVMELRTEREIIGKHPLIERVIQTAAMVAPTRTTVLIQGESGTGKELFARAIHQMSPRREAPFITLNCAGFPDEMVESALFGHERGAFTGAVQRVAGAFERANGGTLLLDEISELKPDLQGKLLRVIQEQEFVRVGGQEVVRVDVRIVATTNRDIQAAVHEGAFRQDLFYRIAGMPILLPPLRDRKEDIPLLAYRFARTTAGELDKNVHGISPEALAGLQSYDWPGNVRELEHVVQRAVILTQETVLQPHCFEMERFGLATAWQADQSRKQPDPDALILDSLNIADAEALLIQKALESTGGNRTQAAQILGISIRTLRNKLNSQGAAGR